MGQVTNKLTYAEAMDFMHSLEITPRAARTTYRPVITKQLQLERRTIHELAETNPYLRDALRKNA